MQYPLGEWRAAPNLIQSIWFQIQSSSRTLVHSVPGNGLAITMEIKPVSKIFWKKRYISITEALRTSDPDFLSQASAKWKSSNKPRQAMKIEKWEQKFERIEYQIPSTI